MSGDVQPRKRKDKKRKKDDLGVEEHRGTAAALGEGDVFMHSQHEHGTGGHWCAKIVFFSLLAVLITLIGLIILENRGLTDLEASTVESRYSGVLEGWLEDAPDDDHHNEHTLELNHPQGDEESEEHDITIDHSDHKDDHDLDDDEDQNSEEHDLNEVNGDDIEQDEDDDEEEDSEERYEYNENDSNEDDEHDTRGDDDEDEEIDDREDDEEDNNSNDADSAEGDDNEEENDDDYSPSNEDQEDVESNENLYDDDEEEDNHDDPEDEHEEIEVEHIEHETFDEEPISTELPALPEDGDELVSNEDKDDDQYEISKEDDDDDDENDSDNDDDVDDEIETPIVEHVTAPSGKPYMEVEDSSEVLPADTLADEEEYEKRQEELRREEEQASHVWLKLGVGAALLLATHAVVRRATRRDESENAEEIIREETPTLADRRMTLIPKEEPKIVRQNLITDEASKKELLEEVIKKQPILIQTTRPTLDDEEEVEEEEIEVKPESKVEIQPSLSKQIDLEKELYSDEDEDEVKNTAKVLDDSQKKVEADAESEDVPDDVEIIDEDHIEEELEEEEDEEEEISDVDDAELLSRLEAKYGRLPEPERFERKKKDGGNSADDFWPDEPSDPYWRQQLDQAEEFFHQGAWEAAARAAEAAGGGGRARWLRAAALDRLAERRRDNRLLARAVAAYRHLLRLHERLSDARLLAVARRAVDRITFKGDYLSTEPILRLLIRRFPDEVVYRNNLTISFLMANRADLAEEVLKETLTLWPDDRIALAHYGFVLKTLHSRLEEAVILFRKALEGDRGPATEARFYYHLGDALLQLGRLDEAHDVHKRGAALGFFLSPSQRSLYNVDRLESKPWWDIHDTPYKRLALALEESWKEILREGEAAKALYEQEKEGLRERGQWSQLDLFVRGQEIPGRCKGAPVTCSIVRSEPAAVGCRRGQIKFSSMGPGTHVRPHVGPTNCRLRIHLALSNTENTHLRVDKESRQWQVGKVLMFDDSFEHEVWHNGSAARLVLIVDVWHPALAAAERRALPAI